MIKFGNRRNLKYPLQLLLYSVLRDIECSIIDYILKYNNSLIYTPLMFLGEFASGLIIYLYQKKFLKKEKPNQFSVLIQKRLNYAKSIFVMDNKIIIFFLCFILHFVILFNS